jgi:hypothetical protein
MSAASLPGPHAGNSPASSEAVRAAEEPGTWAYGRWDRSRGAVRQTAKARTAQMMVG